MMLTGVTVTRQVLAVQKTLARNGLRTMALLQERGEQVARSFLVPDGDDKYAAGDRHLWEHWSETGQAGRKVVETAVYTYFEMLEGMLLPGERRS
jgi:hypothetical protein